MGPGAGQGPMMGRQGNNMNMNPGPGRGFYPPNQQFGGRGNMNNGGRFSQQQPQSYSSMGRGGPPNFPPQGYPGRGGGGRGGFQQGGQFGGRGPQWVSSHRMFHSDPVVLI